MLNNSDLQWPTGCVSLLKVNLQSSDQKKLTTDFDSLARNSHLLNQSQLEASASIPGFFKPLSVNTNKAKKIPKVKLLQSIWSKDAQETSSPRTQLWREKPSPHHLSPMSMPHSSQLQHVQNLHEQYHVTSLSRTMLKSAAIPTLYFTILTNTS